MKGQDAGASPRIHSVLASTHGLNTTRHNDCVRDRGPTVPLIIHHDSALPITSVTVLLFFGTEQGLVVRRFFRISQEYPEQI